MSIASITTAHGDLTFGGRCLIMGILNVTPDSFSDGGALPDADSAVRRAEEMVGEGADILDIGGESTRPGAAPVGDHVQMERTVDVIRALRKRGVALPISIDTRSAVVAATALDAGADIVNDVSAGRFDAAMPGLVAGRKAAFVVMHMQGTPETMQVAPRYDDVVGEVAGFFRQRVDALGRAGVDPLRIIIDPGLGFGKTAAHNLMLLHSIEAFRGRWPVLVGPSRKRFLGDLTGETRPADRLMGTAAAVAHCALRGVEMVRVHDVRAMRQVVDVCRAIQAPQ